MPVVLSPDFGYVVAAVLAFGPLGVWQGMVVGKTRKAAKVPYPCAYASKELADRDPKAKKFNCAQRAHANTVENLPSILSLTILTGLVHPRLAAASAFAYLVGRVFYTLGYATGDPAKRQYGFVGYFGLFGLWYGAGRTAYDLLRSKL